jgi:PAS domain S-box-containing protein
VAPQIDEFRLLVEAVHDYEIYLLDPEGRIATWNPGAEHNKGYGAEEVLGRHFSLFHTPEDVARGYPEHVLRQAAREGRFEGEGWRVRKDGTRFWAEVALTAVRDEAGTLIGFANLTHDLTERRRAEDLLRKREERFRSLVSATAQIVWVTDPDGVPLPGQSQWSAFTGLDVDRVHAGGWVDAVHPDDRQRTREGWATAVRSRTPYRLEHRVRRSDGEYRTFRVHAVPVLEPDGEVREWVGTHTDVTDQTRAEAERDFLAEASRTLAASLDYETTLASIARLAVSHIADWCGVDLLDGETLRRVAVAHADPEREALVQPFAQYRLDRDTPGGSPQVIRTGEPVLYTEIPEALLDTVARRRPEHREILRTLGVQSAIVVPLIARGEVLGAITLASAESGRRYGPRDLELAEELARRAAIAVDHARLFRETDEARSTLEHQAVELELQMEELQHQAAQLEESQLELEMANVDLRQANTELAAAEAHYHRLVATSPHGVFVADREGRFTELNAAAVRILGRDASELLGRSFGEPVAPESRGAAREAVARVLTGAQGTVEAELWIVPSSGERRLVRLAMTAIREDGTTTGIHGVGRDVTEERRTQEALQRSRDFYLSIFDHFPTPVWRTDASGGCDYFNQTWLDFTGRPLAEQLGEGWAGLVHPADRERCVAAYRAAFAARRTFEHEYRLLHHSGEYRAVVDLGHPLYGLDGEFLGYTGAAFDVHEQRRLEERLRQAERMEAVGRLSGGIAHDFNNLIGVISGTAELILLDLPTSGPLREDIEAIGRAAERAAELTRRLLAFSRQQVLQPRVVDLNRIVQSTEKLLRRSLGEDIELAIALDPALGHTCVDPGQLEHALLNLAINARDAMPRGGRLSIETGNVELGAEDAHRLPDRVPPGGYVTLRVSDSGSGMAPEVCKRIFEPFFTTKEMGKGTGLGLSTVYGIVKQSGGYIWADSAVGRGTRFEIYLPRAREEEAPAPAAPSATGVQTQTSPAHTVLLVEDEASLRGVARRSLERAGYTVLEADGGEAALRLLADGHAVDLLFTDVVMPRMSGRELAERARALIPDLKVLYTSGHTDEAMVHHQVQSAEVAFLPKPYGAEALLRTLADLLNEP